MVHLRMQPEGYGAAIYTFELQSLIASSSPQFLLLRCCEVLLFCRLVCVLLSPSDGCFLVSSGLRGKAQNKEENNDAIPHSHKHRENKHIVPHPSSTCADRATPHIPLASSSKPHPSQILVILQSLLPATVHQNVS